MLLLTTSIITGVFCASPNMLTSFIENNKINGGDNNLSLLNDFVTGIVYSGLKKLTTPGLTTGPAIASLPKPTPGTPPGKLINDFVAAMTKDNALLKVFVENLAKSSIVDLGTVVKKLNEQNSGMQKLIDGLKTRGIDISNFMGSLSTM